MSKICITSDACIYLVIVIYNFNILIVIQNANDMLCRESFLKKMFKNLVLHALDISYIFILTYHYASI